MIKKNIIFFGLPGSGKGTISEIFATKNGLVHISTGMILREQIAKKTELGLKLEKIVSSGEYVSDEIVNLIVKEKIESLKKANKNFVLDGFPRTLAQSKFLEKYFANDFLAVLLSVSKEEVISRLSNRRVCSLCKKNYNLKNFVPKISGKCDDDGHDLFQRTDDKIEAIQKRLQIYEQTSSKLIDFYRQKNFLEINCQLKNPTQIYQEIVSKII